MSEQQVEGLSEATGAETAAAETAAGASAEKEPDRSPDRSAETTLPQWAGRLIELYESHAANQFIVYGNIEDRVLLPNSSQRPGPRLGSLKDFLLDVLLPGFDVVLSFDLGNGIRVERGAKKFNQWPYLKDGGDLPKTPHGAVRTLTRYFRYTANLARLRSSAAPQVACLLRGAHLLVPAVEGSAHYELNAIALLLREWASDDLLVNHSLATFLMTENLNDIHPLIEGGSRTASIKVPLPDRAQIARGLDVLASETPIAIAGLGDDRSVAAGELVGASLGSVEKLLRVKEHRREAITPKDLVALKKGIVEEDLGGLIEFVQSPRSLKDYVASDALKNWLRQDLELWRQGEVKALPKGYLFCGPVGTGKTFLAECLAGEAGVPVVVIKNFREKWVGTTEGNLEKIFRLLHALGRCFVFIDEADQTLGKRGGGDGDSGLSGRVYSMIAQEMSSSTNRGKIIWILASSRPDLVEVDLKRPGRVDCKIPLFPSATAEEGFQLMQALGRRYGLVLEDESLAELESLIPRLLTPAAAEALAFRAYRDLRTEDLSAVEAFRQQLEVYRSPVPLEVLEFQMRLAAAEATDLELVPEAFRHLIEGS